MGIVITKVANQLSMRKSTITNIEENQKIDKELLRQLAELLTAIPNIED